MRALLIAGSGALIMVAQVIATLFSLHIHTDPINTGYLHLGAAAACCLVSACAGFIVGQFTEVQS